MVLILIIKTIIQVCQGKTQIEIYKWEDLDYAIREGQVTDIPTQIYLFNQQYPQQKVFKAQDHKVEENFTLKKAGQLRNIYDEKPLGNLYRMFFPH